MSPANRRSGIALLFDLAVHQPRHIRSKMMIERSDVLPEIMLELRRSGLRVPYEEPGPGARRGRKLSGGGIREHVRKTLAILAAFGVPAESGEGPALSVERGDPPGRPVYD